MDLLQYMKNFNHTQDVVKIILIQLKTFFHVKIIDQDSI